MLHAIAHGIWAVAKPMGAVIVGLFLFILAARVIGTRAKLTKGKR